MPLQGDQRALLQLLVERGQSYEDIAGLLGGSADDVRERARAALTEIGGADPDTDVALTDFLLGQADPIGRADAIRHLQADPAALDLAKRIQTGLAVIASDAEQPKLPEPRGKRRKAALPDTAGAPAPVAAPAKDADVDAAASRRRTLIAGLATVGLLLVVGILAVAGVFDGSGSASDSTTSTGTTTSAESNITTVPLKPVGGSGVAGKAVFGLVADQQQLYVDVDVQGLDPNLDTGKSYLVWLMVGDSAGYPIDRLDSDQNGGFSGRLSVPTPIAVAVGNQAKTVRISATPINQLQAEIKQATKQKVPILPFTGDELASGDIPLVRTPQGQGGGGGQSGN